MTEQDYFAPIRLAIIILFIVSLNDYSFSRIASLLMHSISLPVQFLALLDELVFSDAISDRLFYLFDHLAVVG